SCGGAFLGGGGLGGGLSCGARAGATPGEQEEHVVERGAAQAEVLDVDAAVLQRARHVGQRGDPVAYRGMDSPCVVVAVRFGAGYLPDGFVGGGQVGDVLDDDLDPVAANRARQGDGGVVGDDSSGVDHRDAVG